MKPSPALTIPESFPVIAVDPSEQLEVASVQHLLPLQRPYNRVIKRTGDLVLSSLLLLLAGSWLMPLLALLVKMDSRGPVFFLQQRNKKGGVFRCIKFRTMVVNRDADIRPAAANDPRITRAGRFLRRHHLDELPQLLNVWMGDMSLIGPRPYMLSDNERYEACTEGYALRHCVQPGITGLAQASGHFGSLADAAQMKQRLELDLHYVRNWSVGMDLRILGRTLLMFVLPANKRR